MNTKDYGNIPQNRERIYIVGFRDKSSYDKFNFPQPQILTKTISDMLDTNSVDDCFYYTKDKNSFYLILEELITKENTVYQWRRNYVRENKSGLCPTLTASMGTGGNNVPIIKTNKGIRKLIPRECFNFQGFPKTYKLPNIANSHLYKQAGNSVSVPVIKMIAESILIAIEG